METQDTDGAYALPQAGLRGQADASRRKSKRRSERDPAREDTSPADKPPNDYAVELSLLQSVFDQAITAGLLSKTTVQMSADGQIPVLTIQLWNVSKCPECESWIVGLKCPIC